MIYFDDGSNCDVTPSGDRCISNDLLSKNIYLSKYFYFSFNVNLCVCE